MYYHKKNILLIFLILFCIFYVYCGKNKHKIIGKWEEIGGTQVIEFLENGSLIGTSTHGKTILGDYKVIDENRIVLNYSRSSSDDITMIAFFKIVDNELTLTTDQDVIKYQKAFQPPQNVKEVLDRELPDWRIAPVREDIQDYFKNQKSDQYPFFIKGDFDGNGLKDYALRIYPAARFSRDCFVIALLNVDNHLEPVMVGEAGDYIILMKKGTRDYDHDSGKEFSYPYDAISSGKWEVSGWTWLYENGQFKKIFTSD